MNEHNGHDSAASLFQPPIGEYKKCKKKFQVAALEESLEDYYLVRSLTKFSILISGF